MLYAKVDAVCSKPVTMRSFTCSMLLISVVFSCLFGQLRGGCKFANQQVSKERLNDLDAAKFAAKMAIAHKGMDVETLKERQKR